MQINYKVLPVLILIMLVCGGALASSEDDQLSGLITGRTGELLEIRLTQPVKEGTVFQVKSILSEPPIAEAKVVSCTKEWPYIALAKVETADLSTVVPIGAKAFADVNSVEGPSAPKPMRAKSYSAGGQRFSMQIGSFYPRLPILRDTVTDFWQAYRFNYSFMRLADFDMMLSAEYTKGSGDFESTTRSMELIPVTMLGRFRVARAGSLNLVLGAGAGMCFIKTEESTDGVQTSDSIHKFARELAASLESRKGWSLDLRYRDVPDTNVQGWSLGMGARF
ncbi:MAG: hypothetical protein ABFD64_10205 [Armatimonadota bacterium]